MKVVLLLCYCFVWTAASENQNNFDVENLLPKSLLESIQQEEEQQQQRQGRILNNLQYVQHSPGAHSVYLPPTIGNEGSTYSSDTTFQQFHQQQQQQQVVDLHVPTTADANKIQLRLLPQQFPAQQNALGVPPPRRHYRITLVRNRKPVSPPPQVKSPEVEEKTLIYVLVKKQDESTAAAQVEELQKSEKIDIRHHAPEVYFIKYKENSNSLNKPSQYLASTNEQTLQSEDNKN